MRSTASNASVDRRTVRRQRFGFQLQRLAKSRREEPLGNRVTIRRETIEHGCQRRAYGYRRHLCHAEVGADANVGVGVDVDTIDGAADGIADGASVANVDTEVITVLDWSVTCDVGSAEGSVDWA